MAFVRNGYPFQPVPIHHSCARWQVLLAQLLLICLNLRVARGQLAFTETNLFCDSTRDFIRLLADPKAGAAYIRKDLTVNDDDWLSFGIVVLDRNFTIESAAPSYIKLNLNFTKNKIRLQANVTLTFRRLILYRYRSGSAFQAPGLDLLIPLPPGEQAWLRMEQGHLIPPFCFPETILRQALATVVRPEVLPGENFVQIPWPLEPNCTNDTSADALHFCWPYALKYVDVGMYGIDIQPQKGVQKRSGYLIHFVDFIALCPSLLSNKCINDLGPVGCVLLTLSLPSGAPPPTGSISNGSSINSNGGDGSRGVETHHLRAVITGSVLGACGIILIALVAGIVLVRRSRRAMRQEQQHMSKWRHCDSEPQRVLETTHSASCGKNGDGCARSQEYELLPLQMIILSPHHNAEASQGTFRSGQVTPGTHMATGTSGATGFVSSQNADIVPPCIINTVTDASRMDRIWLLVTSNMTGPDRTAATTFPTTAMAITSNTPLRPDFHDGVKLLPPVRGADGGGGGGSNDRVRKLPLSDSTGAVAGAATVAADTISPLEPGTSLDRRTEECKKDSLLPTGRVSSYRQLPLEGDGLLGNTVVCSDLGVKAVVLTRRVLGKGATGWVYEGLYDGQPVAVKMMVSTVTSSPPLPPPPVLSLLPPVSLPIRNDDVLMISRGLVKGSVEESPQPQLLPSAVPPVAPHACSEQVPLDMCSPRFGQLFRQEVEILGRCCHPNIVRLLAACLTPPRLCLVMELMETSLEKLIYGGGPGDHSSSVRAPLPLPTVLHIAAEVAQGLEYLHPTIIHRDLKPANVLINGVDSPTPVVKLSDFGLSRIRSATMPTLHPEAGTPAYLAPECYDLHNDVVTHHADMYALGVLMWTMLTGHSPWKDHTVVAMAFKVSVLKERLPLQQLSNRRCPPQLRALVMRCWEEDPQRRPAAAEAAKELRMLRQEVLLRNNGGGHRGVLNTGQNQTLRSIITMAVGHVFQGHASASTPASNLNSAAISATDNGAALAAGVDVSRVSSSTFCSPHHYTMRVIPSIISTSTVHLSYNPVTSAPTTKEIAWKAAGAASRPLLSAVNVELCERHVPGHITVQNRAQESWMESAIELGQQMQQQVLDADGMNGVNVELGTGVGPIRASSLGALDAMMTRAARRVSAALSKSTDGSEWILRPPMQMLQNQELEAAGWQSESKSDISEGTLNHLMAGIILEMEVE